MERVSGLRQTRVLCVHLTSSSSNREGVSPTRPDCPSYSVVVLAQWQLVSLHEVPVSPSIQVSQPFRPAWGEFGPLPVRSEGRRLGTGGFSSCDFRLWPDP